MGTRGCGKVGRVRGGHGDTHRGPTVGSRSFPAVGKCRSPSRHLPPRPGPIWRPSPPPPHPTPHGAVGARDPPILSRGFWTGFEAVWGAGRGAEGAGQHRGAGAGVPG